MRGRKRQRKKDEKRRGVWGLPIIITHKRGRGHEQDVADALSIALSRKINANREEFYRQVIEASMKALYFPIPRAAEILAETHQR